MTMVPKQARFAMRMGALSLLGLLLLSFILLPFAWSLLSSFQTDEELFRYPPQIKAAKPWFVNYYAVATGKRYGQTYQSDRAFTWIPQFVLWIPRAMLNTLIICFATVLLSISLGALSAYALTRFDFRGKGASLSGMLAMRAVPTVAILIPLFVVMRILGLLDRILGVVLVMTAIELPFAVWILREYFATIPLELEDAARIDGCTRLRVLAQIVMPVAIPGVVVTAIIVFMAAWSAFQVPLILTKSPEAITLQVVAAMLVGERDVYTDHGLINAVAVVSIVPPILLALFFQRYVISGIARGAIK